MAVTPLDVVNDLSALITNPAVSIIAHLASNPIDELGDVFDLMNLVECNFPGYAPQPLGGWSEIYSEDDEDPNVVSDWFEFTANGILVPQFVTAVYVTATLDGGGLVLLTVNVEEQPLLISQDGESIERRVRLYGGTDAA